MGTRRIYADTTCEHMLTYKRCGKIGPGVRDFFQQSTDQTGVYWLLNVYKMGGRVIKLDHD